MFGLFVMNFLSQHLIVPESHKTRLSVGKPISRVTLRLSNVHLGVTPPLSQLRSHAVDLDPPKDAVPPPATTDLPSNFVAPPPATPIIASDSKIVDAIAAIFAHMNVIHKDLVEHIGQVHERIDLIVERQEHDIKAIRDTLSALSR